MTETVEITKAEGRQPLARVLWKSVRKPLARSVLIKSVLVRVLALFLLLVKRTNPVLDTEKTKAALRAHGKSVIFAIWHGQHLILPAYSSWMPRSAALFSRSADAELNAAVAQKLGVEVIRGSGGREGVNSADKGGARALISLRNVLRTGRSVVMIADIPHGTPREAGLGIVTLARISGRPIIPVAYASSRRKVIEKSWDKTTVNLPFGQAVMVVGEPVNVDSNADAAGMESNRRELTESLNQITSAAYRLVDGLS